MKTKDFYNQYYATRPVNESWERHKREIYPAVRYEIIGWAGTGIHVLEVGCGMGDMTAYLERDFKVTAIDLSRVGVEIAKEKVAKSLVLEMDARKLYFIKGDFDCVVMSEVLEHIAEQRKALKEASRVLKPGGVLVVTTPFPRKGKRLSDQGREYPISPSMLNELLLGAGFRIMKRKGLVKRSLLSSNHIYQMVVAERG